MVIFHNFKAKHDPSYSVEDFKHFYIERARNNINIERNLLYLLWKKKKRICITGSDRNKVEPQRAPCKLLLMCCFLCKAAPFSLFAI